MEVKSSITKLNPYQPGKSVKEVKDELGLDTITKLASNENPFGCSSYASSAVKKAADMLAVYPDGSAQDLRKKVSSRLGVSEGQLIFGNGSDEVIQIVCRALLDGNSNTITASPTFPQYRHNAVIEGAEVREVTNVDGEHDLDSMVEAADAETKIIWLCSPNNPTGTYIGEEKLQRFLERVPSDILVVLDEAYYEYVTAEDYPESIPLLDKYSNLMILRTFSKAYGLAGLRIGYGVGNEEFIRRLEPAREPFNVNSIAQIAAAASLDDSGFLQETRDKNRDGITKLEAFCKRVGLDYFPSQGNFVLVDFHRSGDEVFDYLLKNGFIVRSGSKLGYPTSVRITIGDEKTMDDLISVLEPFVLEKAGNSVD
ncbi:histidinol-phosphate transaminase [Bacillus marinisedimentorum]|uniref:histidinol-phosphate transaminase n=1 Tax=Bacillus marinisedimentorum TaxID=1821260 RepID=UPI00087276B3|nr:histidinol-phosphate transaminase [Bacillus marinisedimentorum]